MNSENSPFSRANAATFPIATLDINIKCIETSTHGYRRIDVRPSFLPITGSRDEQPDRIRVQEILDNPSVLHHLHASILKMYPYQQSETTVNSSQANSLPLKNRPWRFLYSVEIPENNVRIVDKSPSVPTGMKGVKYDPFIDVSEIFPYFHEETRQLLAVSFSTSYIKRLMSRIVVKSKFCLSFSSVNLICYFSPFINSLVLGIFRVSTHSATTK